MTNKTDYRYKLGIAFVFLYTLAIGVADTVVNYIEHQVDPFALATIMFLIAIIVFNAVTARNLILYKKLVKYNKYLLFKFNVTTMLAWLPAVYALKFLNPAVVSMIIYGTIPLATVVVSQFNDEVKKPRVFDVLMSLAIAALIVVYSYVVVRDNPVKDVDGLQGLLTNLALVVISGFASAVGMVQGKTLNFHGFSVTQVLASRFYLTFLMSFILAIFTHANFTAVFDNFGSVFFVTVISLILPTAFIFNGIKLSDQLAAGLIVPLTPCFTFFIQFINPEIKFTVFELNVILILTFLTVFSGVEKAIKIKKLSSID